METEWLSRGLSLPPPPLSGYLRLMYAGREGREGEALEGLRRKRKNYGASVRKSEVCKKG